jgi:hypothetical protein
MFDLIATFVCVLIRLTYARGFPSQTSLRADDNLAAGSYPLQESANGPK